MRHRVYESPLPGWSDPAELARALFADRASAVWLDSGIHATEGMSYLGFGSRSLTASVARGTVTIAGQTIAGEVFDLLREDLALHELPPSTGFRLGWVGWLGYGLAAQTMGAASAHQSRYADASLVFVDSAIAFDHSSGSVTVLGLDRAAVEELLATVQGLRSRGRTPTRSTCGRSRPARPPSTSAMPTSCASRPRRGWRSRPIRSRPTSP
jgi:para-aminobenzoate synthetase component 1